MARLSKLRGATVYLDTNLFIYAVEGYPPEEAFVRELFEALERGELAAATSELALAEALVRPFALGWKDIAAIYAELLSPSDRLAVVPVDRTVLVEAARQRAALGLRMPDAIHVASALAAGCGVFLTNDRRLRLPAGVRLELL
jgi:predicted nucleic acid-binding protein